MQVEGLANESGRRDGAFQVRSANMTRFTSRVLHDLKKVPNRDRLGDSEAPWNKAFCIPDSFMDAYAMLHKRSLHCSSSYHQ